MAKTRLELKNIVIKKCKVGNDATALAAIDEDLEIANGIVANKRNWSQLKKRSTVSLTSSDGDISYALSSDVDEVGLVRVTSPANYAKPLKEINEERFREYTPDKTLVGRATPNRWYFDVPTISAVNVETKNISFNLLPDQSYTVTYNYKAFAPALDADGKYPFFDPQYHIGLYYYAAWKFSERSGDPSNNPIYWRGEWDNFIKEIESEEQSQAINMEPIPYEES